MARYAAGRVLALVPVLAVVGVTVFLLIHLIPGDPASVILGPEASQAQIAQLRTVLGLDRPVYVQLALWFERVRAGFAQRRKMLRGTVGRLVPPDAFDRAGVRPDARPEELDVEAWGRLAECSTGSGPSPS